MKLIKLVNKDLALFVKSFSGAFGFAFMSVVLSTFTLGAVVLTEVDRMFVAQAASWLCFAFSAVYVFSMSIEAERKNEAIDMILLSKISPSLFFFAKWISCTLVICLMQVFICVLFEVFFTANFISNLHYLALIFLLSSSAISAVGMLFTTLSSYLKNKEMSLPIIIFPLSIPILFSGVELSNKVCLNQGFDIFWLSVLLAINTISLSLCWLFFDRVIRCK